MFSNLYTKELTPDHWPEFEKLFSPNGACGGCWCIYWRTAKGEKWKKIQGAPAKKKMKSLILLNQAQGVLAFQNEQSVGWCVFGKRKDFLKLDRAPSFACEDAEKVWSIPCFFVKSGFRGKGVATSLLRAALRVLKTHGAKVVEGYPVKPNKDRKPIPAAFAWTGTRSLFLKAGFEIVGNQDGAKQRVRKKI